MGPPPGRKDSAIVSQVSIYRFLFRLAADSRRIAPERLLQRLVTGLANRYGAAG